MTRFADQWNYVPPEPYTGPAEDLEPRQLLDRLLVQCAYLDVSDIHIEAEQIGSETDRFSSVRIRTRVNGIPMEYSDVLKQTESGTRYGIDPVPLDQLDDFLGVIFIAAVLSRTERGPQSGAIEAPVQCRVETAPTATGLMVVIRIFGGTGSIGNTYWGTKTNEAKWERMVERPNGLVVVSGPTGSGKSSTIRTALFELLTSGEIVTSIEDPVEVRLPGARQMQPATEDQFTDYLRSIMRADSDTLYIGEIRDKISAQTAIQSALRGKRVLTTVHANDAPSTIISLLDLGANHTSMSATLAGIVCQRLVRMLCKTCNGKGCVECNGTGYKGRIPICEVMPSSPNIIAALENENPVHHIRKIAVGEGMLEFKDLGRMYVESGITDEDEVRRVIGDISSARRINDDGVAVEATGNDTEAAQ